MDINTNPVKLITLNMRQPGHFRKQNMLATIVKLYKSPAMILFINDIENSAYNQNAR